MNRFDREKYVLQVVWYCEKNDQLFQSGYLEGIFCALAGSPEFWKANSHIHIVGLL